MPIGLHKGIVAAALLALPASPALGQAANPLEGQTKAPQAGAFGPVAAPLASRGKLEPDPASGGVVFTDEQGWYRFTMANGGEASLNGTIRRFSFKSGGQNAVCFAVRTVNTAFAKFQLGQIQAELETLYTPFDPAILASGAKILKRETIVLDATGQRNAAPIKVLGWDTIDANDTLVTYVLSPMPAGQLMFACGVGDAGHAREIMQRYLRIAEGGLVPAK